MNKIYKICFILLISIISFLYIFIFAIKKNISLSLKNKEELLELKKYYLKKIVEIENVIKIKYYKTNYFFNEDTKINYNTNLDLFCQFINSVFQLADDIINIVKVNITGISFDMFTYKRNDAVSTQITKRGYWELSETNNLLSSLEYYNKKMKLSNNDISVLDIGANIGWFSIVLGKKGYNIMSFEPSKTNYYILKRNYCLNPEINITIINKALDIKDENCSLYHWKGNRGNGNLVCNPKNKAMNESQFIIEKIEITRLSYYIPYLIDKNLALIKIDIEGGEGHAIESGIDLIIKYHIPFIFLEFTPRLLKSKGTDPKLFLELFENNGYKISIKDFLSKDYCQIEELMKKDQINIYIVYTKFLD